MTSSVVVVAALDEDRVIAGGSFSSAGGAANTTGLAIYSYSSNEWSSMGFDSTAAALVYVLADGDVIIGGNFTTAGGIAARGVVRWDPDTGTYSPLGTPTGTGNGVAGVVTSIVELPNGDLLVGGLFTSAGGLGATSANLARYSPSTNTWAPVCATGQAPNNNINVMVLLADGDVVIGGGFNAVGGVTGASRIVRFDPDTNSWSAIGSGVNNVVYAMAVLDDGDVLVGGSFTTASGTSAARIARVNPATGVWTAIGTGAANSVYTMARRPNGEVVLGGRFNSIYGIATANRVAVFEPATNAFRAMGIGVGTFGDVLSISVMPNQVAVIGGGFPTAAGSTVGYITSFGLGGCEPACPPCAADYDNNGGVDGGDLAAFFADFETGETCADVDGNGGVDGGDLGYFFTVFEAGGC